ncbi:MAG: hypothetical protein ACTS6G_04165 [Candidatus Hodgkinia cicadicola]
MAWETKVRELNVTYLFLGQRTFKRMTKLVSKVSSPFGLFLHVKSTGRSINGIRRTFGRNQWRALT